MKRTLIDQNESSLNSNCCAARSGRILRLATVIGVLALLAALPASQTWAAGSCSQAISSCGCTITAPGFYYVTANLTAAQGLTAAGDCIDVSSVGVTLWTAGYSITGAGDGAGIELGSVGTFVEGEAPGETGGLSFISEWAYGVELKNAINTTLDAFDANVNIAGVYLSNSIDNTVSDFDADNNLLAGVLLDHSNYNNINDQETNGNTYGDLLVSSSNNQINDDLANNNSAVGVEIGCPNTTVWSGCKNPLPSNGNQAYNSTDIANGVAGIEVENGSHRNIIADNSASGNGTTDLVDKNPSCDQDVWFANAFGTANPSSCIH